MSTWISKRFQINDGSYGILTINAGGYGGGEFDLTTFSYIDCGGNHQHNNFSLKLAGAIKMASVLYLFATTKKSIDHLILEQEYKTRGKLHLRMFKLNRLDLSISDFPINKGQLSLTRKQAKKLAGYLFYWAGERMIGMRRIKQSARTISVRDINDEMARKKGKLC